MLIVIDLLCLWVLFVGLVLLWSLGYYLMQQVVIRSLDLLFWVFGVTWVLDLLFGVLACCLGLHLLFGLVCYVIFVVIRLLFIVHICFCLFCCVMFLGVSVCFGVFVWYSCCSLLCFDISRFAGLVGAWAPGYPGLWGWPWGGVVRGFV